MNKLIFRKLSLDILWFFLLSSIGITLIVWVVQAVNLLDIVSEDGHSIKVYLLYTLLNLPKIFSKLLIFIFFISIFFIINKYEENNEILVFWTNGIKKIQFINFIFKYSLLFLMLQLALTLFIVPYTQYKSQSFLKNSSIDFFPKLLNEKKFSNVVRNLTLFVENYDQNGNIKGIYIKERINKNETKVIIANSGKIYNQDDKFFIRLNNGGIINIDKNKAFNLNFKETEYDLSKFTSKTRKRIKLNEVNTLFLLKCINQFKYQRKDSSFRCGIENSFLLKDIYEEIFKRIIFPIYIIVLGLISTLLILKSKSKINFTYLKFNTF
ncbi:LptF/LptG family permease, partial [Candidatus Pelagibacter sp.]|nr:LptF/LptG family permease [Candidatus Pelagibacter sp.]